MEWTEYFKVLKNQDNRCFYCNVRFIDGHNVTKDHFYAKSFVRAVNRIFNFMRKEAEVDIGNIVAVHEKCNGKKGTSLPTQAEIDKYKKLFGRDPRFYVRFGSKEEPKHPEFLYRAN